MEIRSKEVSRMMTYTLKKITGTPDWDKIDALKIDNVAALGNPDVKAFGKLCYGDDGIFVRLWAYEKSIRAEEKGELGSPCEDSCLEFFFSPDKNDTRYFNIEFNPNKCMFLGIGTCIDELYRLLPENRDIFSPDVKFFDGGWQITYFIPFDFIRCFFPDFKAESGTRIRANCYKCGDKTEHEHYFTWNPIDIKDGLSFHRPQDFGEMVFE